MKNKLVNWTEGMDVSSSHFTQTENYFIEAIQDSNMLGLTQYNYGLLPTPGREAGNGIIISDSGLGTLEIKLMYCNAVTSSGIRIAYNPEPDQCIVKQYVISDGNAGKWDVFVSVNPFERVPTGELDPNEDPPRHPHAVSKYQLIVSEVGKLNKSDLGPHYLNIGRITSKDGKCVVDNDYIPPCTSILCHNKLDYAYNRLIEYFFVLERHSVIIIEKILQRSNTSELGVHMKNVCQEILRYIASVSFDFNARGRFEPPIKTVNYIASLAHVCLISFHFIEASQKEKLFAYFAEWGEITPGYFKQKLPAIQMLNYNHNNINEAIKEVQNFMENLTGLWEKLSSLEYIGQHKDNIIITEHKQESDNQVKVSWSTLG